MPLNNYGLVSGAVSKLTRSAQPDAEGAITLVRQGVRTVVKLCIDSEYSDLQEREEFRYGALVLLRPLPGLFRGGLTSKVISIAQDIATALQNGAVHVHCTHGRDRTGLVCAAFRMLYDGVSLSGVDEERRAYGVSGMISWIDRSDEQILAEIEQQLAKH